MENQKYSIQMDASLFSSFLDMGWITDSFEDGYVLTSKGEKTFSNLIPKKEDVFFEELHKKLKARMKQITGSENKVLYGDKYFIPAKAVIKNRLLDASKQYKFKIDERIEKVLLKHVTKAAKTRFLEKPKLVMYFILGQNGKDCGLATALENFKDDGEETDLAVKSIDTYL